MAQLLPVTCSRCCRQSTPWPRCHGGCSAPAPPRWCRGLSADNGREGTTCSRPRSPAMTRPIGTPKLPEHPRSSAARGMQKGLHPPEHPTLTRWHGGGWRDPFPGPAGGDPQEQSRSPGRCWLERRRWEAGGRRALCPRWFLFPRTHAPSRPLYAQQKGGTSVTICIANQAAPAASSLATCAPRKASAGRSRTRGTGALWAGTKTPTYPRHRRPRHL